MNVDVCIVGGGMVGATLALALAKREFSVAVIEPGAKAPGLPAPYDLRVSALTRASQRILDRIGAWSRIPGERLTAYDHMRVWDAGGNGEIGYDAADIGEPDLGHILENGVLVHTLHTMHADNLHWLRGARWSALEVDDEQVTVRLAGKRIRAKLLVGADGARSGVRERFELGADLRDYRQSAVVANVRTEMPHQHTAWQRFLATGPLAFLPLPETNTSAVVWSTTPEQADRLLAMSEAEFTRALGRGFDFRLGVVEHGGERAAFPLRRLHARAYTAPRVALVGDAAHVIHPLAGQGVNLGLLDAAALVDTLARARDADRDIGRVSVLRRYERWRKGHNQTLQSAMDGIRWLFGQQAQPIRFARNLGLNLTDGFKPAKRLFMENALGLTGDLPSLAQPDSTEELTSHHSPPNLPL